MVILPPGPEAVAQSVALLADQIAVAKKQPWKKLKAKDVRSAPGSDYHLPTIKGEFFWLFFRTFAACIRSPKMPNIRIHMHLLAKIDLDTAENEPFEIYSE